MPQSEPDGCPRDALAQLRQRYPDAPFLALGQTVFWDEPVKAALRKLLDDNHLGGHIILGVHDTDYFAKAQLPYSKQKRFALMPHNDGSTKSLWSAAGEISTLFGSETFPTRHDYARCGVAFRKLARAHPGGAQAFLDDLTEAWGWRGLVYTGSRDLIVHYLPLKEVGDGIMEMLRWGFDNALSQIVPGCCQDEAKRVTDTIMGWCADFRQANPDKNLTHLFQHLLPLFYELLLGSPLQNISVDCTTNLLRLTPATAHRPRFRFVDLFLNPDTREHALHAYNTALAGSEMYTLDRFGAGALPFDIILPERGRGTLRVTPRVLFVETRQPVAIGLKKPVESIQELAEILNRKLGDEITLVGKAVSLVSMLAQEFIFVFNEEGSLYVRRTRQMNDMLAEKGIALDMRPILRMRYHTWDALCVGKSTLRPTEHLAAAFGQKTITTPEFAAHWKQVIQEQRQLCKDIAQVHKPLQLLQFLQKRSSTEDWEEQTRAHQKAKQLLYENWEEAAVLQKQIDALYATRRQLKQRSLETQTAQGAHFRSVSEWTPEAHATRAAYKEAARALCLQKRSVCGEIRELKVRRLALERSADAVNARETLAQIEARAELARMQLVRNALLTIEGLTHTNHRPSVWWLPVLDPAGDWFRRLADTAEVYMEPLLRGQESGVRGQ